MKLRLNFISNSSSCSFVVPQDKMTEELYLKVEHWVIEDTWEGDTYYLETGWNVYKQDGFIHFETSLDNYCMISYLKELGVTDIQQCRHSDSDDIEWKETFEQNYGIKLL